VPFEASQTCQQVCDRLKPTSRIAGGASPDELSTCPFRRPSSAGLPDLSAEAAGLSRRFGALSCRRVLDSNKPRFDQNFLKSVVTAYTRHEVERERHAVDFASLGRIPRSFAGLI
jgi:hypothetical protein